MRVTDHPDGSRTVDTEGMQTPQVREALAALGVRLRMVGGVPSIIHAGHEWPYVDGMRILPVCGYGHPHASHWPDTATLVAVRVPIDTPAVSGVVYPRDLTPCGSVADIRSRRRRLLSHSTADVERWESRSGGPMRHGTPGETFRTDHECGANLQTRDGSRGGDRAGRTRPVPLPLEATT